MTHNGQSWTGVIGRSVEHARALSRWAILGRALSAVAGAGLAPLVLHRVAAARYAYFGLLALVNILLLHATVVRCYGGDYGTLRAAMPFLLAP